MSNILKLNACVFSRKGSVKDSNTDGFYLNGKFISQYNFDNIQAATENKGIEYVFAVSDSLEHKGMSEDTNVSMMKELTRFHEKITVASGDLDFKINEFTSKVEETKKLINSLSSKTDYSYDNDRVSEISNSEVDTINQGFAGLLMSDGKAVAVNIGSCRIYLMREGTFKHMTVDYSKAQRLLQLGIISDEQAETLNEKFGVPTEPEKETVNVSEPIDIKEGDKFLICSDGLYNSLSDERIQDIMSLRSDSSYIAYTLAEEATKRGNEDDITAMVLRVDKSVVGNTSTRKAISKTVPQKKKVIRHTYKNDTKTFMHKNDKIITYAFAILTTALLIAAVVMAIGKMFANVESSEPIQTSEPQVVLTPTPIIELTPTSEPTIEPTPTPTPTPVVVPEEVNINDYGTINQIAISIYGESKYGIAIQKYNKIEDPTKIGWGQKIKLLPKQEMAQYLD